MHIFALLSFLLITLANTTTYSMILAPKQECYRKSNAISKKQEDRTFKKPISVSIHPHAELDTMATMIGKLPLALAQKKAHELTPEYFSYLFEQQYENQKDSNQSEILKILSLPVEVVHPIFIYVCNNHSHMFKAFCSQPLGKALEWLTLLKEKHQKDEKLKHLISFPELYVLPREAIIELANATRHFTRNKTTVYPISFSQESTLCGLPQTLKNDAYFNNKQFTNQIKALYRCYKKMHNISSIANLIGITAATFITHPLKSYYYNWQPSYIDALKDELRNRFLQLQVPIYAVSYLIITPIYFLVIKKEEKQQYERSKINDLRIISKDISQFLNSLNYCH